MLRLISWSRESTPSAGPDLLRSRPGGYPIGRPDSESKRRSLRREWVAGKLRREETVRDWRTGTPRRKRLWRRGERASFWAVSRLLMYLRIAGRGCARPALAESQLFRAAGNENSCGRRQLDVALLGADANTAHLAVLLLAARSFELQPILIVQHHVQLIEKRRERDGSL